MAPRFQYLFKTLRSNRDVDTLDCVNIVSGIGPCSETKEHVLIRNYKLSAVTTHDSDVSDSVDANVAP